MDTLSTRSPLNPDRARQPRIAILGAGFSGMGMAIALKKRGLDNFTIYEKADDVGGTWRENVYPGVACDVPSHLYSFSFEPNPDWSKRFSPGGEIWDYMKRVAKKYGLYEKTAFGKKVVRIRHDGRKWAVDFADGTKTEADIVVSGLGGLHEPNIPRFEGRETFRGPMFHTAQWRGDVDLKGKRVAIIGSAASAVQVVPEIAPQVAHLDIFQRTANWIMPRPSYQYPGWAKALFRAIPQLARLYRGFYFSMMEWRHGAFEGGDNYVKRFVARTFDRHMREQVKDPALRAKLTPTYPVGCKRILISDRYLPAVQRDNVDIVTASIDRIEEGGVRSKDGALHEADVIILATGFKPFNLLDSIDVVGPAGTTLAETWRNGVAAHRTVAVPGFPNFFMLLGPNSGLGHNSVILMIEAQVNYVLKLIEAMRENGAAAIEPAQAAAAAYDKRLQQELKDTVWAGGCQSWYLDATGRNYTLYPHTVRRFIREMKAPDLAEYAFVNARAPA
ncbi:MAG: NAD(P)/FAD-dependent oxidoreductase [Pseudomonadota bacterium]|nr:NAD(P)/FAD-dependent oxidoreductase [Pseudomonadota bacterium]